MKTPIAANAVMKIHLTSTASAILSFSGDYMPVGTDLAGRDKRL